MGTATLSIDVAGQHVTLTRERAAFWHERSTLLVADLHLGKAHALAAGGRPVSDAVLRGVTAETLERLGALVSAFEARRVLVLGDLLHAPVGVTPALLDQVATWRRACRVPMALVPGNHDRSVHSPARAWNIDVLSVKVVDGPFTFVHDPAQADGLTETVRWCGHVHPAIALAAAGDRLKLPCFVVGRSRVMLPAFSRFTSGGPFESCPGDRVVAVAETALYALPEVALEIPNRSAARRSSAS